MVWRGPLTLVTDTVPSGRQQGGTCATAVARVPESAGTQVASGWFWDGDTWGGGELCWGAACTPTCQA